MPAATGGAADRRSAPQFPCREMLSEQGTKSPKGRTIRDPDLRQVLIDQGHRQEEAYEANQPGDRHLRTHKWMCAALRCRLWTEQQEK